MTVFHLTSALERLEFQFYAAMNNLYCYGLPTHHQPYQPQPQQSPGCAPSPTTTTLPNEESSSNVIKRINERLSTLEGRQKIIQSKISQLDNLYGQTTQAWGKSIKEMIAKGGSRPNNHPIPETHRNGGRDELIVNQFEEDKKRRLQGPDGGGQHGGEGQQGGEVELSEAAKSLKTQNTASTSGGVFHEAANSSPDSEPPPAPQPRQEDPIVSKIAPLPSSSTRPPNDEPTAIPSPSDKT